MGAAAEGSLLAGERHLARSFPPKPVAFVRGAGHILTTADGHDYVDLGGASHGVANFGHNHPRIVEAVQRQARDLIHDTMTIPSPVRAAFLDALHRVVPGHLERTFLANSGTEAVEAALKHAVAATGRSRFVALKGSFHGRSLGALSATFRPQYRKPFADALAVEVDFIAPNDEAAVEVAVTEQHAGILVEPVQGEGGLTALSDSFLRACQRVAHAKGALLIVDEIQTGLGRTGRWFGFEHDSVVPDVVMLAKALGNGMPVGACWAREDVATVFEPGDHGSTYSATAIATAAVNAVLGEMRRIDAPALAEKQGDRLAFGLRELPGVSEVRGRGLLLAAEIPDHEAPEVYRSLLDHGLVANAVGPTSLRFAPPLTVTDAEVDEAVSIVAAVLA